MLSERPAGAVVLWAPAKVNLFLEVLGKRADGYHDIATLMVAVSLFDTLELKEEAAGHIQLTCDHPELSTGPDNLVVRAAELLKRRTGCTSGAQIRLAKRIPLAAGLAGGSTDAATTLMGLNRLWRLGLGQKELAGLAAELGSDIAFFFSLPAAWCTGRGEITAPAPMGRPLDFVLVCPPVGLSTADVYRNVVVPGAPLTGTEIRQAVADGNGEEIGRRLFNRLEPAAEGLCPEIAVWRERLAQQGPAGVRMSGSGSSLFALCRDPAEALRVARAVSGAIGAGPKPSVFVVRSCI